MEAVLPSPGSNPHRPMINRGLHPTSAEPQNRRRMPLAQIDDYFHQNAQIFSFISHVEYSLSVSIRGRRVYILILRTHLK